jgi:hypothetical protein
MDIFCEIGARFEWFNGLASDLGESDHFSKFCWLRF